MTHLFYIEDALLNNASFQVERKKKISLKTLIGIGEGLFLILFGSKNSLLFKNIDLSILLIVFGVFLIGWCLYRMVYRSYRYVYKPTGEQLKRKFYYISPDKKPRILRNFRDMSLRDLLDISSRKYSNLMIDIWHTSDGKIFYYQLNEFKNQQIRPLTDVQMFEE